MWTQSISSAKELVFSLEIEYLVHLLIQ